MAFFLQNESEVFIDICTGNARKDLVVMKVIDIHQHVLPSVDDGAKDMERTLDMLRICQQQEMNTVIATPHFDRCRYRSEQADLPQLTEQVNEACIREGIAVKVLLGAEVFCEPGIYQRLKAGRIPTLAGSRYVLMEYGYEESFSEIQKNVQRLAEYGFTAILAHAERYSCIRKNPDYILELKEDFRTLVQVNASDLTGEAGFWMQRYCQKLLKNDLIDFIATDAHNISDRPPLIQKCVQYVTGKKGEDYAEKIFWQNPQSVILNKRL